MTEKNYFEELNDLNVADRVEEKNGLSYLSWPWAWGELKKRHPGATFTIYENAEGWNYHTDGRTAWVKTGVTVNGIEHVEELPIMDHRNKSIPLENITSYEVNKAIQRSITKAIARHGLGLYIYAGEDLPEVVQQEEEQTATALAEAIKEISTLGTALIKAGYTREDTYTVVGRHNKGETNPGKIASIEIAEAIKKEFAEMLDAKKEKTKEEK